MAVLAGRCVPGDSPVPYRPLTEAFASRFHGASPPGDRSLAGFGGHLGKLVPQWRGDTPGGADESAVLLGEAMVRLATLTGADATLLILDAVDFCRILSGRGTGDGLLVQQVPF
jgi:hypothetical protein